MSRAWPVDGLDGGAPLGDNARQILAVRIAEYYSHAPAATSPEADQELHDLRISAKRLRYTLELFRPVFEPDAERNIERVRAVQESLGNLHDADVRVALIEDELNALAAEQTRSLSAALDSAPAASHPAIVSAAMRPPPDDPRRGLLALLGRVHLARRVHYAEFRRLWDLHAAEGLRVDLVRLSVDPSTLPSVRATE